MPTRKQDPWLELQGLRLRLCKLGDPTLPWTVQPRLTTNLLIDLAISRLLLIEAVAQPVLRFPRDEARDDVDIRAFRVAHLQPIALLDRPTVAGLAPFVVHRAARIDDTRIVAGAV